MRALFHAALLIAPLVACGTSDDSQAASSVDATDIGSCRKPDNVEGPPFSYWFKQGVLSWASAPTLTTESVSGGRLALPDQPESRALQLGSLVNDDLHVFLGQPDSATSEFLVGYRDGDNGPEVKVLVALQGGGDVQVLGDCGQSRSEWLSQVASRARMPATDFVTLMALTPDDERVLEAMAQPVTQTDWEAADPAYRIIDPAQTPKEILEGLAVIGVNITHDGTHATEGFICSRSSLAWGQECTRLVPGEESSAQILVHAPPGESAEVVWSASSEPNSDAQTLVVIESADFQAGRVLHLDASSTGISVRR